MAAECSNWEDSRQWSIGYPTLPLVVPHIASGVEPPDILQQ